MGPEFRYDTGTCSRELLWHLHSVSEGAFGCNDVAAPRIDTHGWLCSKGRRDNHSLHLTSR